MKITLLIFFLLTGIPAGVQLKKQRDLEVIFNLPVVSMFQNYP